jgi:putative inorganic carbon (HCO3(-)) transporter
MRSWKFYFYLISSAIPLFFVFKNETNSCNVRKILSAFSIVAMIVAVIGLLEWLFGRNIIYEHFVVDPTYFVYLKDRRLMSSLTQPIVSGAYFLTVLPLVWFFYKGQNKKTLKLFAGGGVLMVGVAMLLTFSRGTWLSFVLMLIVVSLILKKVKYAVWGILFLILTLFVASLPFVHHYKTFYRFSVPYLTYYLKSGHRTLAYRVVWRMFLAHPFAGIGWKNYTPFFRFYSPYLVRRGLRLTESGYLQQLAEGGVFSAASFLIFIFNLLRRALKSYHILPAEEKPAFLAIILGLSGLLININTFNGIDEPALLFLFWTMTGLVAALSKDSKQLRSLQSLH